MAAQTLYPVEGVRALTHISVMFLHAAMLTTAYLPSEGPLWMDVRHSKWYTFAQAGGIQVDIMFMLTGFLLVWNFLSDLERTSHGDSRNGSSIFSFSIRRILRLLPAIVVVSFLGLYFGDNWNYDGKAWKRILVVWTFIMNYLPSREFGSFTLSPCWSCCVDVQAGTAIYGILLLVKYLHKGSVDASTFAKRIRWLFLILTIVSVGIRAMIFEENHINLVKFGQVSHFGVLQSTESYNWIHEHYNHTWQTANLAGAHANIFIDNLYQPTHTRFGPLTIGGFLACQVFLAYKKSYSPKRAQQLSLAYLASQLFCLIITFLCIAQLLLPCFPASDDPIPLAAQHFITAAMRVLGATSTSFIVFRAIVPEDHPWHWASVARFLSLPIWQPVATLSYCSYLIHFRLMFELNFNAKYRDLFVLSSSSLPVDAVGWMAYTRRLFAVTFVFSMIASCFLYFLVELPASKLVRRWMLQQQPAVTVKTTSKKLD